MLLIQYIKNSVFSVSSVVNLLNQILSQSRTHCVPFSGSSPQKGTRCVPYRIFMINTDSFSSKTNSIAPG